MSEVYRALYNYTSTEKHVLSFRSGAFFTVVNKNSGGWWTVQSEEGQIGTVPGNYLVKDESSRPKSFMYEAEFDFTAMGPGQLSLKLGEQLKVLNEVSSQWWEVKNSQGQKGMVPASYIKKFSSSAMPKPRSGGTSDDVLQSIDSAIQQIYDEMADQNDQMSAQQRELLEKLTKHRQEVVSKGKGGKQKRSSRPSRRAPSPPRKQSPKEVEGADGRDTSPAIAGSEPPLQTGSTAPPSEEQTSTDLSASPPPNPNPLPTSFDISVGVRLANTVRSQTGVSFSESQAAAETTLRFVAQEIPQLADVMEGLVKALEASQTSLDADLKIASSGDAEQLQRLFDLVREHRDDRQERGWAVRDDLGTIAGQLQELLKLLSDADPDVCKLVIEDSKYENIWVLVEYYQMELRWPLRLLLLQVFGSIFTLDPTAISVCLSTVLPNVLGKDIQENKNELQNLLYVSLVATMLFSTGELVPLAVYDQWNVDFIAELLDLVEEPPEVDTEDQVPDSIVNVILSFNQHFQDPSRNLLLESLRDNPNRKSFGEKLMLLVNRAEDPVALKEPLVPDSMTKLCIDLFSDRSTAGLLYTSDLKVLVDIIARNLSDRSTGDEARFHYLRLLRVLLGSTDYGEHLHRQDTLSTCLIRIHNEHEPEGMRDKELVVQIWKEYPNYFQLSSSV